MLPQARDPNGSASRLVNPPTKPLGVELPVVGTRSYGAGLFVGRDAEIALAHELLQGEARLLTITGPSGIGKTRLALQLIAPLRTSLDVLVCDLAPCTHAEDALETIGRALGVVSAPGNTDPIIAALEDRGPMIVLFDNGEQVASALAGLLVDWLERLEDVRWLVTSQWRLGLREERVLELAPLSAADAERLWVDRVRHVRPDYDIETERPSVEELLGTLDAIPLAIELAAARRHVLTARAILQRLASSLEVLQQPPSDRPIRHTTLERAISWSWDLLEPWERTLWAQCSVFDPDFTLDAIEAVAKLDEDAPSILDGIEALRDKSMLQMRDPTLVAFADAQPRYALYTSVRAFASARLTDRDDMLRRHAEWTVEHAEELRMRVWQLDCPRVELTAELSNLRAVVERSLDQSAVADTLGARALYCAHYALMFSGSVGWLSPLLERFSARASELPRPLRARLAEIRGRTAMLCGELETAERALSEGISLAEESSHRGTMLVWLAYVRTLLSGEYRDDLLEQAFSHARKGADTVLEARALELAGEWTNERGHAAQAQAELERALALYEASASHGITGGVLARLGCIHLHAGRHALAREMFSRAREVRQRMGVGWASGEATYEIGNVEQDEEQPERAVESYRQAIEELAAVGDQHSRASAHAELGLAYRSMGRLALAASELRTAVELLRRYGDRRFAVLYESALRAVCVELGEAPDEDPPPPLAADDPLEQARRLHELRPGASAELARSVASSATVVQLAAQSYEVRQALRLLRSVGPAPAAERELVIGRELAWVRVPSGATIDLGGRPLLLRLVRFLLERREKAPGRGAGVEAMIAAGWPGERLVGTSGAARLYTAMNALRKLGLAEVIVRGRDGYYLDPSIDVRTSPDVQPSPATG